MARHMVQDMKLDIHPSLIIMDLDQDVADTQEAHQGSHHTLMVHMDHHMVPHKVIHMVPLMVPHMGPHMVTLVILEVPTMAIGKMVLDDKILEVMETEVETFKVARMTSGAGGVALNKTEKKIRVEEIETEGKCVRHSKSNTRSYTLWML